MGPTAHGGKANPWRLLRALLIALIIVLVHALVANQLGEDRPLALMLGFNNDLFADYFKNIFSYADGRPIAAGSLFGLADFSVYPAVHDPLQGAAGLGHVKYTHFHSTPLLTLFCVLSLRAMTVTGGVGGFLLSYAALACYWITVAIRRAESRDEGIAWALIGLLSYPFALIVARGNVYAGFTGVLLIHAMLLASRRQAPVLAAILLAVAVNLRPNAILFALPLGFFLWRQLGRTVCAFCLAGAGVGIVSLMLAHRLYPDYTLHNFLRGLATYYQSYVVGDDGLTLGSSLYGALKFYGGYHRGLDTIALIPSLMILLAGAWGWATSRLSDAGLLFLTIAAYCLGSSVIADYHLLVFMIPLMVMAQATVTIPAAPGATTIWSDRVALAASWLMLIPKNFMYRGNVSYQVVLNPAILLLGAAIVLVLALRMSGTLRLTYPPVAERLIALGRRRRIVLS